MKKKLLLCYFTICGVLLTSCGQIGTGNVFKFEPTNENASIYEGYYQPHRDNIRYSLRDLNSQVGWHTSNTLGEQKMLVIPVQLSDGPSWTSEKLDNLEIAFFGESSKTAYYSVKDFFEISSYKKLQIEGEVIEPFKSSYSINRLAILGTYGPEYLIEELLKTNRLSQYQDYDKDKDGFIDNAIFIYSNDFSMDDNSPYWAFCTYYDKNNANLGINNYMWASYQFLNRTYRDGYNYGKLETHTFIHESGHLMGLDDYYSYDDDYDWDAAGALDMQSYNIGDHNAFSKFALGWIDPYVVTDTTTITLKTSSAYPEAILINDSWNGSAFDEYLLIEYYTPTSLNEIDSKHALDNDRIKMYSQSGLRIYHVDARIVELSLSFTGNVTVNRYVDTIPDDSRYAYFVGASNSVCYSYLNNPYARLYKYLHLLDKAENNKLNNGHGGSLNRNKTLWDDETIFIPSKTFFANGDCFNDGSKIGYQISVSDLNEISCQVNIKKI